MNESGYLIRAASIDDVDFIIDGIISAEKSGSCILSYSTLYDLPEQRVRQIFDIILNEEVSGCEFALDSFLVAERDGRTVGVTAGWIEGFDGNPPSKELKADLISFFFPRESIMAMTQRAYIFRSLDLKREPGTLQIEFVYTGESERGRGVAGLLIENHIVNAVKANPALEKAQVQVNANNYPAIRAYERCGFSACMKVKSDSPDVSGFLPWHERLLMEKQIKPRIV
jgi:ribosomal protein S18 acetylase RimI-like enzyme